MAIVIRYFSTAAAGAGDGTTWADRAALFTTGDWSSVITGFSFAGADSLECRVEGGLTYTCSQELAAGLFANAPTAVNPLLLHGCNSSGALLSPPDPGWVSASPPFSAATLPTIETTTNMMTINLVSCTTRLFAFTASGRTGAILLNGYYEWCHVTNSASHTSAAGVGNCQMLNNSVILMTGTSFNYGINQNGQPCSNVRIDGSAGTDSGNRIGVSATVGAATIYWQRFCIVGCAGGGFTGSTGGVSRLSSIFNFVIVDCGGDGWLGNQTASQTTIHKVANSIIVNSGGFGINANSLSRTIVSNCRLRNNTSGNFGGMGNWPEAYGNITSAGSDTDEFANYAGKDFRIKASSSLWGLDIGAGDEIPTAAAIATAVWARAGRTLT